MLRPTQEAAQKALEASKASRSKIGKDNLVDLQGSTYSYIWVVVADTTYINRFNQTARFVVVESDDMSLVGGDISVGMNTDFMKEALEKHPELPGNIRVGALLLFRYRRGKPSLDDFVPTKED